MYERRWIVARRSASSIEWTLCALCGSAAAAHKQVMELKELAALRDAAPAAWLIAPSLADARPRGCSVFTERIAPVVPLQGVTPEPAPLQHLEICAVSSGAGEPARTPAQGPHFACNSKVCPRPEAFPYC